MAMKTYIALFRGINVVGKHVLPMKALAALLEDLGCRNVRTYIQSGNVVFQCRETGASRLVGRISPEIKKRHGFEPRVMLLDKAGLARVIQANPFPDAADRPNTLHVFFLAAAPGAAKLRALGEIKAPSERFALKGRAFYLHAPDGFGLSKLAKGVERILDVPATARNWRTVTKIMEMAQNE